MAFAGSCHKCNGALDNESDYIAALNKNWHSSCFTCTVCHVELTCTYYAHKGLPYCTKDYFTRFGSMCKKCNQCITGPMISAGQEQFHPECFFCDECSMPVSEGDSFALIDRTKLVCHLCFNQQKALSSSRVLTRVHLPPGTFDCQINSMGHPKKKKKRFLHIFRKPPPTAELDNMNIMGIEEGDQIIEVNGTPVRGQTSEQVMALARENSANGVNLVIERHNSRLVTALRGKSSRLDRLSDSRRHHPAGNSNRSDTPATSVSVCEGGQTVSPSVQASTAARGQSLRVRPSSSASSQVDMSHGSNSSHSTVDRIDSCPSVSTPSSVGTSGTSELFSDEEGDCFDDDDLHEEEEEKEGILRSDTRVASAMVVQRVRCVGAITRTSTMPSLASRTRLCTQPTTIVNSALYRGESISGRGAITSSRSVFRVNDLEFGEVLGEGFFGRAVRVTNKANGDVMVMKELIKCTPEARKTFLQEVQMMKALDHINVMSLLGIMYRDKNLCIITEFIGGGTLSERIVDKTKDLPDQLKISFACDIAAGMAYLHTHKIIHRDLTSNNCMIRVDESVVVGDFGLAKAVAKADPKTHSVVGSAYWMAPEMMAGKGYDFRADIFSFGIITCELIGRISADPDEMPRTMEFGLDSKSFIRDFLGGFSTGVFDVSILCCDLDPLQRPIFRTIEAYLSAYLTAIESGVPFTQTIKSFAKVLEGR